MSCDCGSGLAFEACCGPILAGDPAPTALALMRSRYTAFARGDVPHLLRSWHPDTRPAELELDDTVWRRLQVVDVIQGGAEDEAGIVEFRASWRDGRGAGLLHERSRFVRVEGGWRYLDGMALS